MHIIGQKNANSVKTTLCYGPKESIACPFPDFSCKKSMLLCPYCQKNRPFCEKHVAFMPIFCRKNVHSLKTRCTVLSCHSFQTFHQKTPCFHAQDRSKIRQFCQNYTLLWAKKVNRMPLFSEFSRKNQSSDAHILSKKRPFSKKQTALISIFRQKNAHSLKNIVLSYHFHKSFHKKPLLSCPFLVDKRQFCENYLI